MGRQSEVHALCRWSGVCILCRWSGFHVLCRQSGVEILHRGLEARAGADIAWIHERDLG